MITKFRHALAVMVEAVEYAEATSCDPWDFAVEIDQLRKLGLSENDLRFLVRLQYVDHAGEVTVAGSVSRRFRPTGDLYFTKRTCFVLTSRGIAAANGKPEKRAADCYPCRSPTIRLSIDSEYCGEFPVPTWDAQRRVLSFEGRIVKRFKWHALNQEMILTAYQEEGWPARIDDPLPPLPSLTIKRRLSDTIKCLNRKQEDSLVRFRGDGTGEGVIWEPAMLLGSHGSPPSNGSPPSTSSPPIGPRVD